MWNASCTRLSFFFSRVWKLSSTTEHQTQNLHKKAMFLESRRHFGHPEIISKQASAKSSTKNVKRKMKDMSSSDSDGGNDSKKAKPSKSKILLNPTATDFKKEDFLVNANSPDGKPWNLKISSWNVNGIRALIDKNGLDFLNYEEPHIFCVQETKCSKEKLPPEATVKGYTSYWLSGDTDGYSGIGLYTNITPKDVKYGIGDETHDKEGRVITAEYDKFYLVAAYVPNAGRKLVRLENRMSWDVAFRKYLHELDTEKPVILCGDLNVAHQEIDLANPKTNKRSAGFTQEERDGFTSLLDEGFVDSFRHLHPDVKKAYTFWTYMMNARAKDVGWRLDYFVISKRLLPNLCENVIRKSILGSDHCPITLLMAF